MKLSDLLVSWMALNNLGQCRLPARAAYRVAKAIRKAQTEMQHFDQVRLDLFKEHGETQDGGQTYTIPLDQTEKVEFVKAELAKLGEEDVEWNIPKLSLADLGNAEIEPGALALLDYLIDFEGD